MWSLMFQSPATTHLQTYKYIIAKHQRDLSIYLNVFKKTSSVASDVGVALLSVILISQSSCSALFVHLCELEILEILLFWKTHLERGLLCDWLNKKMQEVSSIALCLVQCVLHSEQIGQRKKKVPKYFSSSEKRLMVLTVVFLYKFKFPSKPLGMSETER